MIGRCDKAESPLVIKQHGTKCFAPLTQQQFANDYNFEFIKERYILTYSFTVIFNIVEHQILTVQTSAFWATFLQLKNRLSRLRAGLRDS